MFWNNFTTNPCQLSNQKGKSPVTANTEYKTLSDCTHTGTLAYFYILHLCCIVAYVLPWKRLLTENIPVGEQKGKIKPLLLWLICCNAVNWCLFLAHLFRLFPKINVSVLTAVQWHTYIQAQTQVWTAKYTRILCRFRENFPLNRWIILNMNVSSLVRIK